MAALGLRFTDGTTTITVTNGTTGILTNYRQGSANEEETSSTDKAKVVLLSSLSTIQATVGSLNRLYRQARNYQRYGVGAKVFVERDLGDGTWWRSEILDALPVPVDSTLDSGIATGKMELELVFTRRNYWEGAETQLPLTNANGTDNTSGLTIYSIDDSQTGKDNWVDIDGVNDVTGDLPAPIKIEYTNSYSEAVGAYRFWLSLNWKSSPSNFEHILEGEGADGGSVSRSVLPVSPDYTLYSNGQYDSFSVGASEAWVYWDLDSTYMARCAGNYFRVMVKPTTIPSDTWMKVQVLGSTGTGTYYESDYVLLDTTYLYQELCVLRLPPIWPIASGITLKGMRFQVVYKRPTGTTTMGIDYLELLPLDGYRRIDYMGVNLTNTVTLTDNQYDGELYDGVGVGALTHQIAYGGQIRLEPGVAQRLYVVAYGANLPLRTGTVKIWYRPRRLVL